MHPEFKIIPFSNGDYIACSDGYVISPHSILPRFINITVDYYPQIQIKTSKGVIVMPVHRAIALTFIPNPDKKPYVHHIDHNKRNSRVDNLIWATPAENARYYQDTITEKISKIKTGSTVLIPSTGKVDVVKSAEGRYFYCQNTGYTTHDNIELL